MSDRTKPGPGSSVDGGAAAANGEGVATSVLRAAPLLPCAIGLMFGVFVDSRTAASPAWAIAMASVAAGLLGIGSCRRQAGAALVLIAAAGAGWARHHQVVHARSELDIARFVDASSPPPPARSEANLTDPASSRAPFASSDPSDASTDAPSVSGDVTSQSNEPTRAPARAAPTRAAPAYAAPGAGAIARVRGRVVSEPRLLEPASFEFARWSYGGERTVFELDCASIEAAHGSQPVDGRIHVSVHEAVLDLRRGDDIDVFGRLTPLRPPDNPGGRNWALQARRDGIRASLLCDFALNVTPAEREPPRRDLADASTTRDAVVIRLDVAAALDRWRQTLRDALFEDASTVDPDEAGLLQAIVLGQRAGVSRELTDAFVKSGCMHFMAVSGAHLAALILLVVAVGRLATWSHRFLAAAIIGFVVLYALGTDLRYSILRAAVMTIAVCVCVLVRRRGTLLNTLAGVAALFVLIFPPVIFDVSFQLSFAAVCGIGYLAPALGGVEREVWIRLRYPALLRRRDPDGRVLDRLHRFTPVNRARRHVLRWVVQPLQVSMAAWLVTAPIIAWHFHRVQPWGALTSVPAILIVGALVTGGFLAVVIALVSPTLALPVKGVVSLLDGVLIAFVNAAGALPWSSVAVGRPGVSFMMLYYVALGALVWAFRTGSARTWDRSGALIEPHRRPRRRDVLAAALLAAIVVAWGTAGSTVAGRAHNSLRVTVLSVGRGLATVLELPDGRTVLYDAGSDRPFDAGARIVAPFLRSRGIDRVDLVYLSHANLDHYNALPGLLDELRRYGPGDALGPVVTTSHFASHSPAGSPGAHLLEWLAAHRIPVETLPAHETTWRLGDVEFERLWPPDDLANASVNDTSLVLRVTYAGRSVLLTGDIEDEAQLALIERGGIQADVLLLPHHGSVRNSSPAFIDAVDPEVCISSHGRGGNLERTALPMILRGRQWLNTADVGAVEVVLSDRGVTIGPAR